MNGSWNDDGAAPMAVFDVCDTLYYSNTTHDFVRYVMEREPRSLRKAVYIGANSKLLPLRYAMIAYSVRTGDDVLKRLNVGRLKGRTRQELRTLAREFTEEFLDRRRILETHELVDEQKRKGLRVVLCSSSIEPVVAAVAERLGIDDLIATTLEYESDVFAGRIAEDITRNKLSALARRGMAGSIAFAVSDNVSDLELLSAAEKALVIVHGTRKEGFWREHGFETLKLGL